MGPDTLFVILTLIFSVIVHEVMHGVAADWLGDPTARYAGRLTINPIPHIDVIGSIIVPILSSFGGFFFGWAKPVPINPYNFRRLREWGEAITAAAGPLSNLALALIFGVLMRLGILPGLESLLMYIVAINCSLFMLNLIPIPPLDGSKILTALLPYPLRNSYLQLRAVLDANFFLGFFLVIIFVNVFGSEYSQLVFVLARTIAGM